MVFFLELIGLNIYICDKVWLIICLEFRMDVVCDNLIDSMIFFIFSLDSGFVLDLDMVELIKGKMKLMVICIFIVEEVKEFNKRWLYIDVFMFSCYDNSIFIG